MAQVEMGVVFVTKWRIALPLRLAAWLFLLLGLSGVGPAAAFAGQADLPETDLSIFINHASPNVGLQQVIFTIHVSNLGPNTVSGITVVNTLPPGMVMDIPGGGIGWDCGNAVANVAVCTLPSLDPGASADFLGISFIPPAQGGTFTDTATVTGTLPDPVAANNTATDSAMVSPAPPISFYTVTPCRLVDTRAADGPALAANGTRDFFVNNSCGVPSDAQAVAVNVTVVGGSDVGDLRVYPTGIGVPGTSTINFVTGQVRANSAVVPVVGGEVSVRCDMPTGSTGTVDFLLDVSGYFK